MLHICSDFKRVIPKKTVMDSVSRDTSALTHRTCDLLPSPSRRQARPDPPPPSAVSSCCHTAASQTASADVRREEVRRIQ